MISVAEQFPVAFDPELTPGARNAIRVCLDVQERERVTLVTDRATLEIANPAQKRLIDDVEVGRPVAPKMRVAFEVRDGEGVTRRLAESGAGRHRGNENVVRLFQCLARALQLGFRGSYPRMVSHRQIHGRRQRHLSRSAGRHAGRHPIGCCTWGFVG